MYTIGPYYGPTAVQAKRQYLFTSQVSRYCLLHLKNNIVFQKILDKSGKKHAVLGPYLEKSYSRIPDYSGNMVSKFHVDWIKTQEEIASNKTCTEFKEPDKTQYIWA